MMIRTIFVCLHFFCVNKQLIGCLYDVILVCVDVCHEDYFNKLKKSQFHLAFFLLPANYVEVNI